MTDAHPWMYETTVGMLRRVHDTAVLIERVEEALRNNQELDADERERAHEILARADRSLGDGFYQSAGLGWESGKLRSRALFITKKKRMDAEVEKVDKVMSELRELKCDILPRERTEFEKAIARQIEEVKTEQEGSKRILGDIMRELNHLRQTLAPRREDD